VNGEEFTRFCPERTPIQIIMEQKYLTLTNEQELVRIPLENVFYITIDGNLLKCVSEENQHFYMVNTLKAIGEKLDQNFYQISRYCIINLIKLKKVSRKDRTLYLTDNSVHSISSRRIKGLMDNLG